MANLTDALQAPAASRAQPEARPALRPPEPAKPAKAPLEPNRPIPPAALGNVKNILNPNAVPIVIDLDGTRNDDKLVNKAGKRAKATYWQAAFVKEGMSALQNPNFGIRITAESLQTESAKKRA